MKVIKQQVKKLIVWGLRRYVKVVYTLEKRGGEKRKSLNIEDIKLLMRDMIINFRMIIRPKSLWLILL